MEKGKEKFFIWKEMDKQGADSFFSPLYDSKEKNTRWHRMICRCWETTGMLMVSCYAGNRLKETAEYIMKQENMSLTEKKRYLASFLQKEAALPGDLLLHEIEGRYLLLLMEGVEGVISMEMRIEFPKRSWVEYLPGVYEEKGSDSFLERFLCIFQSLYEEVNETIREYPFHLCPKVCDVEYLSVLAGWLDVKTAYFWKEEQLRYLLGHLMEFYEHRGTPESICWLVKLYTGEKPFLVEYFDVENEREGKNGISKQRSRSIRQLYGENPFQYTLLVRKEYKALSQIIKEVTPAHMECRIIVLHPSIHLNAHSYLGINSRLQRGENLF